jgi:hypothetical protein
MREGAKPGMIAALKGKGISFGVDIAEAER